MPARRVGFLAGRLALHAALEEAGFRASAEPILRDGRGRPVAAFAGAPPLSIAHTKRRAIAIVAMPGSCAAIGVDVEEVAEEGHARRAEALVRMAISPDELRLVQAADPALVEGPLALWCARESCVKAHALEVGWFGTALVVRAFERCAPFAEGASGHWRLELAFEDRAPTEAPMRAPTEAPMTAFAWRRDGAVFGAAVSA